MKYLRSRIVAPLGLLALSLSAPVALAQDVLPPGESPAGDSHSDQFLSRTQREPDIPLDASNQQPGTVPSSLGDAANASDLANEATGPLSDPTARDDTEEKSATSSLQIAPIDFEFPNTKIRGLHQIRKRERPGSPPVFETVELPISLDTDMQEFVKRDLPPETIRVGVSTVAAQRHPILLKQLRKAKGSVEQEKVLDAMRSNYEMHYAVECWWRRKKLEELEAQVARLRSQLEQRVDNQAAYVKAAMTIADLYADGVSAPPPVPMPAGGGNSFAPPASIAPPASLPAYQGQAYGGDYVAPMATRSEPSPRLPNSNLAAPRQPAYTPQ